MILVTGGAGFIGSNFIFDWLAQSDEPIINLDKLTYAGNLQNLAAFHADSWHHFVNSRLNTARVRNTFGLSLPDWRIGVARMLREQQEV